MKRTANLIVQHLLWRGLYFFSVLILNILISRLFAAEKSGQIFYIINNLSFVLLLVSMSLESGAVFFISSGKLDGLQMARFFVIWTLFAATVAASLWWLGLHFTGSAFSRNSGFLVASLLFIGGVLMTSFFNALFYAKQQFGLSNKILFGVNLTLIVLLVSGSHCELVSKHFLLLYFFTYFLQGLLLMLVFFIWYPEKKISGLPASPVVKKVFRYAAVALAANVIYFLVNRMDYWFVERYCSARDLGNYIQASKLGQMMLIVPSILAATLFPLLSSREQINEGKQLQSIIRTLLWLNVCICLPLICFGSFLFPAVFGRSFDNMYRLFILLIPGILAFTANYPLAAWFSARDRIGINITGSILALLVILAGDLLVLPRAGVLAASCTSSVGYFCYYCYTLMMYRKENASPLKDFLIIRKNDLQWIFRLMKNKISGTFPEKPIAP